MFSYMYFAKFKILIFWEGNYKELVCILCISESPVLNIKWILHHFTITRNHSCFRSFTSKTSHFSNRIKNKLWRKCELNKQCWLYKLYFVQISNFYRIHFSQIYPNYYCWNNLAYVQNTVFFKQNMFLSKTWNS